MAEISFNFNYWMVDIRNEKNLGFFVNYPDITGAPIYSNETCCIKNFTGWNTDSKNFYLSISYNNVS